MEVRVESLPGVEIKPPAFGQAVGDFLIRDYSERPPEAGAKGPAPVPLSARADARRQAPDPVGGDRVRGQTPGSERAGRAGPDRDRAAGGERHVGAGGRGPEPRQAPADGAAAGRAAARPHRAGWPRRAWPSCSPSSGVVVLRRRERRPVEPRRQTPEEVAHAALALLLPENLPARGLVKEFYLRLTGIVRQYVEDTTGIRAPEQTTEEFLRDIRSRAGLSARPFGPARRFPGVGRPGQIRGADARRRARSTRRSHRAQEFVNLAPAPAAADGRHRRGMTMESSERAESSCERIPLLFLVLADPRPIVIGRALVGAAGPRRRPAAVFSSVSDLKGLPVTLAQRLRGWLPYLYGLGLCLVIAGLARPQAGKAESRIAGQGIAIEMVLDVSGLDGGHRLSARGPGRQPARGRQARRRRVRARLPRQRAVGPHRRPRRAGRLRRDSPTASAR